MSPEEKSQITTMENDIKEMKEQFSGMRIKLDKLYYALVGNDLSQDGGLVQRLRDNEDELANMKERVFKVERKHEKHEMMWKIVWIIVGAVGTGAVTLIANFIKK